MQWKEMQNIEETLPLGWKSFQRNCKSQMPMEQIGSFHKTKTMLCSLEIMCWKILSNNKDKMQNFKESHHQKKESLYHQENFQWMS
jgi:hypothetical protein